MITIQEGEHLYQRLLQEEGFSSPCAGNHTCGKCKIQVHKGILPYEQTEECFLTKEEQAKHIHLACFHKQTIGELKISLLSKEKDMQISGLEAPLSTRNEEGHALVCDIGTTSVVCVVIDLKTGQVIKEERFTNPQRAYGADVIARIEYVMQHGVDSLRKPLLSKMEALLLWMQKAKLALKRMVIVGNPTMMHIFEGIDVSPLVTPPYTSKVNTYKEYDSRMIFSAFPSFVIQRPGSVSAYVGSDAIMGSYELHKTLNDDFMYLDLGTNGELIHYQDHSFLATSTAAGPAFEGGNMRCGCAAIKGAIAHLKQGQEAFVYETIGNGSPIGICGSGYIELLAYALKHHVMEANGYLENDMILRASDPSIVVTQKDVREFQLAKGAIAAALELLWSERSKEGSRQPCLYIAGGFGKHLDVSSLFTLGVLSNKWKDSCKIVGNYALFGACQFAIQQDVEGLVHFMKSGGVVELMEKKAFVDIFCERMLFESYD